MKLNEPLTPEEHARADDEYRRVAENQKNFLAEIASIIESGEPLNSLQRKFAAGAIREFAKNIPLKRKKPAGNPQTKIPDEAFVWYADRIINMGMSENKAMESIAEKYQASMTAVKKKLGKTGSEAERFIALERVGEAFQVVGGRNK